MMKTHRRFLRSRWLWGGVLLLAWLLTVYPKPASLFRTVARFVHLPIEPAAVAHISVTLPNDPAYIEDWVREEIIYDANDYAGWGVIFYIASPEEVLRRGRAPCYGRVVVLASILEDKGIPYRVFGTAFHTWVDYAGRKSRSLLESPQYAVLRWEDDRWHLQGMGWLQLAPLMVTWGFSRFYWPVLPWFGKMAVGATVLGGVWWYFRWQVKEKANSVIGSWVLILLLSVAPILVGIGESVGQEYPETELALDRPFSLLTDAIVPSVAGPTVLLGVVGYLWILAVHRKRFGSGALPLKPVIWGALTLLVLATLWLAVVWTHWNVIMVQRIGSRDLRPVPLPSKGSWVFVVGWVWTGGVMAVAVGFAKKRMSAWKRTAA